MPRLSSYPTASTSPRTRAAAARRSRWLTTLVTGTLCALTSAASAAVPTRDWGTYLPTDVGSWDAVHAVVIDAEGNMLVAGETSSTTGIATPGAPRTTAEQHEGFLMKIAPDGTPLWGTYIGGSGDDRVYELALAGDTLLLIGGTDSPGMATVGAFDTTDPAPMLPVSFARAMKTDGQLLWSTYLRAGLTVPAIDRTSGAMYVAGSVNDPVPGLTNADSHQQYSHTTHQESDGYLARLDDKGQVVWGTYYGGESFTNDEVSAIFVDGGDVYIAGTSESSNGIATPGTHKDTLSQVHLDAFLARFTADGERVWGTYYGNDSGRDRAQALARLPGGDLVIAGWTDSELEIATPGAFQDSFSGDVDVFLARFTPAGQLVWGTYYGGPGYDSSATLTTTPQGQIYLGMATDSAGLASSDGFQIVKSGDSDLLLAKFAPDGTRRWATYYGGAHEEFYYATAASGADTLVVVGGTASQDGIASPGALDTTCEGDVNALDAYVVHFSQGLGVACDGPRACPTGFCVDGVCCESECGGGADDCQACAVALGAAQDGACTPLGPDVVCRPGGACDPAETCDGQQVDCPADVTTPDGDPCDGGVCMADMCVPDDPTGGASGNLETDGTAGDAATGDPATSTAGGASSSEGCACASDPERGGLAALVVLGLLARRRPRGRAYA